jgi:hypothetical protein
MKSRLFATALIWLGVTAVASGAGVWIDSSQVTLSSTGATVINARLRTSAAGVDQMMANGAGSTATIGATLGHNVGNVAAVSTRNFAFTLEHRVGQGLIFRLVDDEVPSQTWLLAYGTGFSPGLPPASTTVVVASQATLGGLTPASMPNFNSLQLEVRATDTNPAPPTESAEVSGLYFSSSTLALRDGAFEAVTMTPTTPGSASGEVVGGLAVTAPTGVGFQRLVADESLTAHDWTFGGMVHLQRSGGGDGEGVRFVISGQQVAATFPALAPVPEPTVPALLGLVAALGLRRRRGLNAGC